MGEPEAPAKARPAAPSDPAERRDVLGKAQEGDRSALPRMLAMFDEQGSFLAEVFGNLAAHVETAVLAEMSGKNLAVREGLERKLSGLRRDLAGPDPTPIERLLAERAAFCWLKVYEYENTYLRSTGLTLKQAEYHQRRIDAAHRRFLSSLRTLAAVRRLGLPAIQVNVAEKQVNVAKTS